MARSIPDPPAEGVLRTRPADDLFSITLHVVTPLFGGSDEAGKVDLTRPVNAKTVRGHLRFWWRACMGPTYKEGEEERLFADESAIWGNTRIPSPVDVSVEVLQPGTPVACAQYERDFKNPAKYRSVPAPRPGYPAYALFPFQGELTNGRTAIANHPATALEGVAFQVTVRLAAWTSGAEHDKLAGAVEAALWAWVHFGGIGARTRRGCGCLWSTDPRFQANNVADVQQQALRYVQHADDMNAFRPLLPVLAGARLALAGKPCPPFEAWNAMIGSWKSFRQAPPHGRNAGHGSRPGRSKWPEPDALRRHARRASDQHQPEHPAGQFYPRADLGLPIIFHFKDLGDPADHALQGTDDRSRMASPVILKPLAISATQAVPMALLLNAPHIWDNDAPGLYLNNRRIPDDEAYERGGKSTQVSLLYPSDAAYRCNTARLAFLRFLRARHGFPLEVQL